MRFSIVVTVFAEQSRLQREIAPRGEMWKQPTILNDVAEPAPDFHDCSGCDRVAIKLDFARIRCEQTDDQTQDGRFTATAGTDQRSNLAARNFEVDVGNRDIVAENFADRAKVNKRVHALMQSGVSVTTA